jgi:protein-disulfide isomerase
VTFRRLLPEAPREDLRVRRWCSSTGPSSPAPAAGAPCTACSSWDRNIRPSCASQQAFALGGDSAFWTYHNRLLEQQGAPDTLTTASLEALARDLPLDVNRFKSGLASVENTQHLELDARAARAASLSSPSFTVNGYYFEGSPESADFRRLIQRALREAR